MIPEGKHSRIHQEGGLLTLSRKVVKKIIHHEASCVPGVLQVGGDSFFKKVFRLLGLTPQPRGIDLELADGEAAMNITVVVKYGLSLPTIAAQMRHRITKALKVMCGIEVRVINIWVASIKGAPHFEGPRPATTDDHTLELPAPPRLRLDGPDEPRPNRRF